MIFRQKKLKKKQKNIPSLKNNNFLGGFCSTIPTPPHISSRTQNVIPYAALLRTHLLRRMIRDLIIVPQNLSFQASLSGHTPRRRKLLLRWTAPQALQSLPLVKVLRV